MEISHILFADDAILFWEAEGLSKKKNYIL